MKQILTILTLFCAVEARAASRYVDVTLGFDCTTNNYSIATRGCAGSDGNAYRTLGLAAPGTVAGDNVYIRSGTVSGLNCQTVTCNSGTAGSHITFQRYASESVTMAGSFGWYGTGTAYWDIYMAGITQDLNKSGSQSQCFNLSGSSGTPKVNPPHHIVIDGTGGGVCRESFEHGASIFGGYDITIRNMSFLDNGSPTAVNGEHGIYVGYGAYNILIEGNSFDDPGDYGVQIYDGDASRTHDVILRANTVKNIPTATGFSEGGIYVGGLGRPYNISLQSNLIYDFLATDGGSRGISLSYSNGVALYNNTIFLTASAGTGVEINSNSIGAIARNNAVFGGSARITNAGSGTICSTNLTSDSAPSGCATSVSTSAATFVDTTTDDYNPKAGSLLIGSGVDLSSTFTTDLAGSTRTVPWSIGAYIGPATPTLTLLSPNGGTLGVAGSLQTLTWDFGSAAAVPNVKWLYDAANDGTFETTISASTPNDGSLSFTAPAATTTGRFRVEDATDASPFDESDGNVTITASAGGEITVIISDNTTGSFVGDITGVTDAYLEESQAAANWGTQTLMYVSKFVAASHVMGLVRFEGLSQIPSTATVNSVTYGESVAGGSGGGSHTFDLRRCLRTWGETTATWNTYDGSNAWGTVGGLNATDRTATAVEQLTTVSTTPGWETVTATSGDLLTLVQNWVSGTWANQGIHLERNGTGNDSSSRNFVSSDGTNGLRPYLSVTYSVTTPTITVTQPTTISHWFPDQQVPIRLQVDGVSGNFNAYLSYNSGASYLSIPIISDYPMSQVDAVWQVAGPGCTTCRVKACSVNDPAVCGESPDFKLAGTRLMKVN